MTYILAYDLGTGGAKASLHDETGATLADAFISYETHYPRPGFHEQNPNDWWAAIVQSTRQVLEKHPVAAEAIRAIGVSGHSLGIIPIGADGALLADRTPIWSDARATAQAARFFETVDESDWYLATGNGFPAHLYSVFKLMWYKDNHPELYAAAKQFVGTKDYINFLLTGRLCSDYSYASGSGVYDLKAWGYREGFIAASGIDPAKFPALEPSAQVIGTLTETAAQALGLHTGVQVVCGGVDNACMALGAGCVADGMAYTSVGSSAWIAVSGHAPIVDRARRPYVFTHAVPGMFVSSTAIFAAGSSFRWLRDTLCRNLDYSGMETLAREAPPGSNRLIFNPSLAGGSSLDKSPRIKGAYLGLTLSHTQGDIIRATLEGICLNLRLALDVMAGYTAALSPDMLIVGGGGKSPFWRSLFADIYAKDIIETGVGQDAGSLGAAALAAVGTGIWSDFSPVTALHAEKSRIAPDPGRSAAYGRILPLFQTLSDICSDVGDRIEQTQW